MILWQEKVGVRGHRLIKFNKCFLSMYYRLKFENCAVTSSESKVLIAPSCLTLCNSMDCSSPGSSVHEILQARILEWVVISYSRGSFWPRDPIRVSCIAGRFFTTPWLVICLFTLALHSHFLLLCQPHPWLTAQIWVTEAAGTSTVRTKIPPL